MERGRENSLAVMLSNVLTTPFLGDRGGFEPALANARSMMTQSIERFADHLLPLLFLCVVHEGLHLSLAILAQL